MLRLLALLLLLVQPLFGDDHDEEEEGYRFRFRKPAKLIETKGTLPSTDASDHGHDSMSAEEFQQRKRAVEDFWRSRSGEITKADVVKLYSIAEDFKVVHDVLGEAISADESRKIGALRQEIHNEVIRLMAESEKFGKRMGINDFGSGADPSKVDAKTDIDFTAYAGRQGVTGAAMVAEYKRLFRQVTAKYGVSVDPGQMDIVAHRYEATIPDWRQTRSLSTFEADLRSGLSLLKNNPEAYFLHGAYLQQVMARSADPNARTFIWHEKQPDGSWKSRPVPAVSVKEFFYKPDVGQRYAWGASVGNWHFFNSHPDDIVGQAKYLLRSLDDGAGQLLGDKKLAEYEKLSDSDRRRVVQELYSRHVGPDGVAGLKALLDTAAHMRALKSAKTLKMGTTAGQIEAYRPLIEFERKMAGGIEVSDTDLLTLAKDRFQKAGNRYLMTNNTITAKARLGDWLTPPLKPGTELRGVDENGNPKKWDVDADMVKRLQYAAFFELRHGFELLSPNQLRAIQDANPRFARDIEILKGIIETEKKLATVEAEKARDLVTIRQKIASTLKQDYARVRNVLRTKGYRSGVWAAGQTFQARGDQLETWLHTQSTNKLLAKTAGRKYLPILEGFRRQTAQTNQDLLGPKWMSRLDKGTSIIEIAKAYVREGELNDVVLKTALYEGFSYVSGVGTLYAVQGGVEGISTIVLVRLIPGYGQIVLTMNLVKGAVELGGLMIFEPLKRDKVLLAYQGYLEPESGGWFTFGAGQKERVESPRPAVTHPVDPLRRLSLEDRREKMYLLLHNRIVTDMEADPEVWYTEEEFPQDWQDEEFRRVPKMVDEYVESWYNATGDFASYDELTFSRGADVRAELKKRLLDDYIIGKNRHIQRMMEAQEQRQAALEGEYSEIAGMSGALDDEAKKLYPVYQQAGELSMSYVLDSMPSQEPAIEILMIPNEDKLSLRAKVFGNYVDHPTPWRIEWEMAARAAEAVTFESRSGEQVEAERGPVRITARAYDAEGALMIEKTVTVEVERVGEAPKEDDDEEEAGPKEEPGPETEEVLTGLIGQATTIADNINAICEEARAAAEATQAGVDVASEVSDLIDERLAELDSLAEEIVSGLGDLDDLRSRVRRASERIAELRDSSGESALETCQAAEELKEALNEEAEKKEIEAIAEKGLEAGKKTQRDGEAAAEAWSDLKEAAGRLTELKEAISRYSEAVGKLRSGLARLSPAAERSGERLSGARDNLGVVGSNMQQLQALQGEAGSLPLDSPEAVEQFQRVVAMRESVAHCEEESQSLLDEAEEQLVELQERLAEQGELIEEFSGLVPEDQLPRVSEAAADASASKDVAEMFMGNIEQQVESAELCMELIRDLLPEDLETFVVVCRNYLPKLPDRLPEGTDMDKYVQFLTVSRANFSPTDQVVFMIVSPDAQELYPAEQFVRGARFATPMSFSMSQSGAGGISADGALLLEVYTVYTDMDQFRRDYGSQSSLQAQGLALLRFQDDSGLFNEQANVEGGRFAYSGGPLEKGWSGYMKQRNLALFKQLYAMFDCFIATEVYQTWTGHKLDVLRAFRDHVLKQSEAGKRLIRHYYRLGPSWARSLRGHDWARAAVRGGVDGVVWLLESVDWEAEWIEWTVEQADWLLDDWLSEQDAAPAALPL